MQAQTAEINRSIFQLQFKKNTGMKQFLKFTLASMLGVAIASLVVFLILLGIIGTIASSSQKVTHVAENSVYKLELKGELIDRSQDDPFAAAFSEVIGNENSGAIGLDDVLANIRKAKENENIKGIYLKGGLLIGGYASIREIRNALLDFKKSGKFIVAYADVYMQSNYYLASVADKVLLNPEGMLELKGLSAELLFFKNTLQKLGIDMQVVKVGTYKSAVEPYTNTKMSDENREQVGVFLGSIWNSMLSEIAASRKISIEKLNSYADEMMLFQSTSKNKTYGLVDSLVYIDQVDSIIASYSKDYKLLTHKQMNAVANDEKYEKNKIAVLYAVGAIDGGTSEGIQSEKLVETITEITKDSSIKAVVFRVSSPGGSAYGSEQIWRALSLLKAKKPLVVSMGDYAASGGYYISAMADHIVAQPTTITGSIGIFGLIPNIEELNNKLGFTYDGVKTNKMSDALSINRKFRPEERELMQNYVDRGYELFLKRCAEGRNKSIEQIKEIAQGRVWTGTDALKIGLVDQLGGLDDALKIAIKKANLTAYMIKTYPQKEDFVTKIMSDFDTEIQQRFLKSHLGNEYKLLKKIQEIKNVNGVQARLPFEMAIK